MMESMDETPNPENDQSASGSSQSAGNDSGNAPKRPLKRKAATTPKKKAKRPRSSAPRLGYTVHQGEDMLLIVSSSKSQYDDTRWLISKKSRKKKKKVQKNKKTVQVQKKKARPKPKPVTVPAVEEEKEDQLVPRGEADNRWGQSLPEELLVHIFQKVVVQDGAVPFLCRASRVCRLWRSAASSPVLWRSVTVSFFWIHPGKTQVPKTVTKIKDTFSWLAENRFTQLKEFTLCHWKENVNYAVKVVSQSCPHLRSLKLSYCSGLTEQAFDSLGLHCHALQKIDLQFSEFQVAGFLDFLELKGSQIREMLFTHRQKVDSVLGALIRGCCPNLEFLEINRMLDSKLCELNVCIPGLQVACPKLKTFRMLNLVIMNKNMRGVVQSCGFPMLEELSLATTSYSFTSDKDLLHILFGSTKLRVLDLRGCSRITAAGLDALPCTGLECLFLGQYYSDKSPWIHTTGLHLLTRKWGPTLQQLDIANQLFTEDDLVNALDNLLCQAPDTLRSLNLSGTRVTPGSLKSLLKHSSSVNYLNLSSCRNLPRGQKRIYRDQEDIQQLLDKLE